MSVDHLDHELASWQGKIAVAAKTENGLDSLKAALNWVKHNVPSDDRRRELAKREISEAAERHLSQTHEPDILDAIYFCVFPEDATSNSDLDAEIIKCDKDAEVAAEIKRLAKLSPIQYEHERKDAAERLGIERVSTLDRVVQAARYNNDDTRRQGRPLELLEIKPWPHPVNPRELLDQIVACLREYLVLPSGYRRDYSPVGASHSRF